MTQTASRLSSAIQTLRAWSRAAQKGLSVDLRRNPTPLRESRPKPETQAAHYALKIIRANTLSKLREEVSGR